MLKVREMLMNMNVDGGGTGGIDGGGNGGFAPPVEAPTQSGAGQPPPQPIGQNPLLNFGQQPPAAPDVQVQPAEELLDFAGRKVKVTDPVIKDIHQDYSNLQRTYQDTNTQMKALQEQNQVYQQMMQMVQQQGGFQQPQQPNEPQAPQPPSQEDIDTFMNNWYENPIQTVDQVISKRVEAMLEQRMKPVQEMQQEREYQQQMQQLTQQYPDFQQLVPGMQEVIQKFPHLADQGLETVYMVAKGQAANTPQQTPEQLLNDPQFRQQIMGNEQIRNQMISQYMQERQQANNQVPQMMGNQPGGSSPATPENQPKTLREASKMFSRYLGI